MSGHAITPSATRGLPTSATPAEQKVLEQACELTATTGYARRTEGATHDTQLVALALRMADESARADIESTCLRVASGAHTWYDLDSAVEDEAWYVERALQYIDLRGEDLTGFRLVRSQAFRNLVRFEEKA